MSRAVINANRREQEHFHELTKQLEADIIEAVARVDSLMAEEAEARRQRQHEEECELVRRQIAAQPARAVSEARIAALEAEVEALEAENVGAGRVVELRRKQFALLMHTTEELQGALEKDPSRELAAVVAAGGGAGGGMEELQGALEEDPSRELAAVVAAGGGGGGGGGVPVGAGRPSAAAGVEGDRAATPPPPTQVDASGASPMTVDS
ncbi:unnamed protein product [Closterium sp. Naga37s-1]|nr:unnamed protein product [Closterium sp. Naga37s-1]